MNPRERMRSSNRKAVMWLLKNGYDDIWLKPHGRRHDLVYTRGEWYRALDLWNLFDGICFDDEGTVVFIQIKTNAWPPNQPIFDFMRDKKNIKVLCINVYKVKSRWDVKVRAFCLTQVAEYFNKDNIKDKL